MFTEPCFLREVAGGHMIQDAAAENLFQQLLLLGREHPLQNIGLAIHRQLEGVQDEVEYFVVGVVRNLAESELVAFVFGDGPGQPIAGSVEFRRCTARTVGFGSIHVK